MKLNRLLCFLFGHREKVEGVSSNLDALTCTEFVICSRCDAKSSREVPFTKYWKSGVSEGFDWSDV